MYITFYTLLFIIILCCSFFFTFFIWIMALKSLPTIIESLLEIELNLNSKTKIVGQIIFSMHKLDMWVIGLMYGN